MNVSIVSKNIEVTDAIRERVENTLDKLEKFINEDVKVNVKLDVKKKNQKIEITLFFKDGYIIRAEESKQDLYSAIDLIQDKLSGQIRRYKTQTLKRNRKNESIKFENVDPYVALDSDEEDLIKRRKKISLDKPMTQEEAIIQMDLLDHDFFIFRDIESDEISVIYKRHDGYGLIEQM
jgi:putative sigma-54 modulation protein